MLDNGLANKTTVSQWIFQFMPLYSRHSLIYTDRLPFSLNLYSSPPSQHPPSLLPQYIYGPRSDCFLRNHLKSSLIEF